MTLWTIAFLFAFFALPNFSPIYLKLRSHFFQNRTLAALKLSIAHLRLIKESLESGLVPERDDWNRVALLPAPWGELFFALLSELRNQGAPILPSLERMILA